MNDHNLFRMATLVLLQNDVDTFDVPFFASAPPAAPSTRAACARRAHSAGARLFAVLAFLSACGTSPFRKAGSTCPAPLCFCNGFELGRVRRRRAVQPRPRRARQSTQIGGGFPGGIDGTGREHGMGREHFWSNPRLREHQHGDQVAGNGRARLFFAEEVTAAAAGYPAAAQTQRSKTVPRGWETNRNPNHGQQQQQYPVAQQEQLLQHQQHYPAQQEQVRQQHGGPSFYGEQQQQHLPTSWHQQHAAQVGARPLPSQHHGHAAAAGPQHHLQLPQQHQQPAAQHQEVYQAPAIVSSHRGSATVPELADQHEQSPQPESPPVPPLVPPLTPPPSNPPTPVEDLDPRSRTLALDQATARRLGLPPVDICLHPQNVRISRRCLLQDHELHDEVGDGGGATPGLTLSRSGEPCCFLCCCGPEDPTTTQENPLLRFCPTCTGVAHGPCWAQWRRSNGGGECPCCRQPLFDAFTEGQLGLFVPDNFHSDAKAQWLAIAEALLSESAAEDRARAGWGEADVVEVEDAVGEAPAAGSQQEVAARGARPSGRNARGVRGRGENDADFMARLRCVAQELLPPGLLHACVRNGAVGSSAASDRRAASARTLQDKFYDVLKHNYRQIAGRPFRLQTEFDPGALDAGGARPDTQPLATTFTRHRRAPPGVSPRGGSGSPLSSRPQRTGTAASPVRPLWCEVVQQLSALWATSDLGEGGSYNGPNGGGLTWSDGVVPSHDRRRGVPAAMREARRHRRSVC